MAPALIQKEKLLMIAEIGVAHCGRYDDAIALCVQARESGFDAVKFQVYQPRDIWTTQEDILKRERLQLTLDQYARVFEFARGIGLLVGASFFSQFGRALHGLCDFLKVAARSYPCKVPEFPEDKPVFVSCGHHLPAYPPSFIPFACVSEYPTEKIPFAQFQYLNQLRDDGLWGYSSHFVVPYPVDAMAAIRQGARAVEKHICLDRGALVVDQRVSLQSDELKTYVEWCRGQMGKP